MARRINLHHQKDTHLSGVCRSDGFLRDRFFNDLSGAAISQFHREHRWCLAIAYAYAYRHLELLRQLLVSIYGDTNWFDFNN